MRSYTGEQRSGGVNRAAKLRSHTGEQRLAGAVRATGKWRAGSVVAHARAGDGLRGPQSRAADSQTLTVSTVSRSTTPESARNLSRLLASV